MLFSIIFGTTFAFKLDALGTADIRILRDKPGKYKRLREKLAYFLFLAIPVFFIFCYWRGLHFIPDSESWLQFPVEVIFTVFYSVAAYPAFQLALWIAGARHLSWHLFLTRRWNPDCWILLITAMELFLGVVGLFQQIGTLISLLTVAVQFLSTVLRFTGII